MPTAGREQQAGLKRPGRGLVGIVERQLRRARRHRAAAPRPPRSRPACATSPDSGASVARTDPRRLGASSSAPASERPRGLHSEQRVAFGALDDARRRRRRSSRAAVARQRRDRAGGQRRRARARRPAARGTRSACSSRSASALCGQLATGEQDHHPQPGRPGGRRSRPARGSGASARVDVLEHEQQRRLARGPAEQRDDRLEQPRALEVGRDRGPRAPPRARSAPAARRPAPRDRRATPRRPAAPGATAAAPGSARPTG